MNAQADAALKKMLLKVCAARIFVALDTSGIQAHDKNTVLYAHKETPSGTVFLIMGRIFDGRKPESEPSSTDWDPVQHGV